LSVALLVGIVIYGGSEAALAASGATEINFEGINTNEERIAFIEGFGVKVDGEPREEKSFRMPDSFDRVSAKYNELQKEQGLDLSKYQNKKVTRYTYKVTNFKETGRDVSASLFIYRDRVIACDVSSGEPDGFVYPLIGIDRSLFEK
jgi:hypothetical protein